MSNLDIISIQMQEISKDIAGLLYLREYVGAFIVNPDLWQAGKAEAAAVFGDLADPSVPLDNFLLWGIPIIKLNAS